MRTIEYWDIERRRYPHYDHTAVIVAEDITSRFLNVISLFNGFIPLIAIQLSGVEVNGAFTLIATRVLDVLPLGTDEEEEDEVVGRASWEQKYSSEVLSLLDDVANMIKEVAPGIDPKYNKRHIGLAAPSGSARNFVLFQPRKKHLLVRFRMAQDDALSSQLDDSELDYIGYDNKRGRYQVRIVPSDLNDAETRNLIDKLIKRAHEEY